MSGLSRRRLLEALAATGVLTACGPRRIPTPSPDGGPLRLGWRWLPGVRHTYTTTLTHTVGTRVLRRAEAWRYTSRDLDADGVLTLVGRPVGFAADLREATATPAAGLERAVQDAAEALADEVTLRLTLSGQVVSTSLDDTPDALVHRLLGLALPVEDVLAGESWPDPTLVLPFARLLPARLPLSGTGTTTLAAVQGLEYGWRCTLRQRGELVGAQGGPAITLQGEAVFETDPGGLVSRTLTAALRSPVARGAAPVGTLSVSVTRDETAPTE